jgi:hypothetical protein
MTNRTSLLLAGALLVAMAAAGCQQNQFTRQNYDTIYVGEDAAHVALAVGKPRATADDRWIYQNELPYYEAWVEFKDGKVSRKHWSDVRPPATSAPAASW